MPPGSTIRSLASTTSVAANGVLLIAAMRPSLMPTCAWREPFGSTTVPPLTARSNEASLAIGNSHRDNIVTAAEDLSEVHRSTVIVIETEHRATQPLGE